MIVGGMTPLDLQKCLLAELESLFSDQLFQKPREKTTDPVETVTLAWHAQMLPMEEGYDWDKYVPYGVVQIKREEHNGDTEPMDVCAMILLCTFNDDLGNEGSAELLNAIEKIRQHIFKRHILAGKYSVRFPFKCETADEEIWPYFVAALETHWALPVIAAEDPFL